MGERMIKILLVEDDEVDAESVRRAFRKQRIANPITHAANGIEALKILRGDETQPALKQPFLILLDLNMPKMDGIEFLEELRRDESLRESIVFVLSTSDEDFVDLVATMELYWRYIEFPPQKT